jgi:hypothetical protein
MIWHVSTVSDRFTAFYIGHADHEHRQLQWIYTVGTVLMVFHGYNHSKKKSTATRLLVSPVQAFMLQLFDSDATDCESSDCKDGQSTGWLQAKDIADALDIEVSTLHSRRKRHVQKNR